MSDITLDDINKIREHWATAVNHKDIASLMTLYAPNAVLKPTLSNIIRRTPEDISEYFLGGKKFNDQGFFNNNNIREVRIPESSPILLGAIAIDTGIYEFVAEGNNVMKAHFSFCYQKDVNNKIYILSQHSSLYID